MVAITYFKYKVTDKKTLESKLFVKFQEVRDYCGISRPQIYRIFNGHKPKCWVEKYDFEQIRIPNIDFILNPIDSV